MKRRAAQPVPGWTPTRSPCPRRRRPRRARGAMPRSLGSNRRTGRGGGVREGASASSRANARRARAPTRRACAPRGAFNNDGVAWLPTSPHLVDAMVARLFAGNFSFYRTFPPGARTAFKDQDLFAYHLTHTPGCAFVDLDRAPFGAPSSKRRCREGAPLMIHTTWWFKAIGVIERAVGSLAAGERASLTAAPVFGDRRGCARTRPRTRVRFAGGSRTDNRRLLPRSPPSGKATPASMRSLVTSSRQTASICASFGSALNWPAQLQRPPPSASTSTLHS